MAWNYENSKNRLSEEWKRLEKADFTVKKLTREMDLSNLGLTEARLVHGVHSYQRGIPHALRQQFNAARNERPHHDVA